MIHYMSRRLTLLYSALCVLLLSAQADAQSTTTGAIAGTVKDTSGAVIPGVTVEVTSPALIEKGRTTVSDGAGQYRVVDLRPGTYAVRFSLAGFGTVQHEDVHLTTGFTASVNAELAVQAGQETITVVGATPTVDVRNVAAQTVLSRELVDTLPGNRTHPAYAAVTLGAQSVGVYDVGGTKGESGAGISIHGSRSTDGKLTIDGMSFQHVDGSFGGGTRAYMVNQVMMQEVALSGGSASAEWETGGVHVNYIPKDGGNTFSFNTLVNFSNGSLQSTNLDDELEGRGVTTAPEVKQIHDVNVGGGGPIARDRLWFYGGYRHWFSQEYLPNTYFNRLQGSLFYEPDLSRRGFNTIGGWDVSGRLTWQAAAKHKFAVYASRQDTGSLGAGMSSARPPEAATYSDYRPQRLVQASWNYPATSKLLLEAGGTYISNNVNVLPGDYFAREDLGVITPDTPTVVDSGLGITYGNNPDWRRRQAPQTNTRFSAAYVTGQNMLKVGAFYTDGSNKVNNFGPEVTYTFQNRRPTQLTQTAFPRPDDVAVSLLGLYAQDQWTLSSRLTLNLGFRYDALHGSVNEVQIPGGQFLAPVTLPAVDDVPDWKDVSPRLGAAYDLFGDGRTAVKVAIGKYVGSHGPDLALASSPSGSFSARTNRNWNDSDLDLVPDCDLQNLAINGECGATTNSRFGTVVSTRQYGEDVRIGWDARDYSWQGQISVQHEVRRGLTVNAGYYRTWYGNLTVTDNLAWLPSDYSHFCITAPTDPRLPEGGGNQVCGLYDVNPALFSRVDEVVTQASRHGESKETFDGVDVGMTVHFGNGGQAAGGVSLGQTVTDNCFVVDSPQQARPGYCRVVRPWWDSQGQLKFNAIYPLPWWGLQTSLTYQNLAGAPHAANYVATNAEVRPTLGRDLASGPSGTVTVPILPPNTSFEDRLQQLDLRFAKVFRVGGMRVQGMFDIYNALNANTVLGTNPAWGVNWLRPTEVLGPRLFKFGAQVDF
jgi:hypothetical protein